MATINFCDLKRKEVINLCDGARLGCICDLEMDACSGAVYAIIVPRAAASLGPSTQR